MDVNDNARCLDERVVLKFFASKLAPTRCLASRGLFFARLLNSKEKACKVRPAVSRSEGFPLPKQESKISCKSLT
jgi:hypothetical protein